MKQPCVYIVASKRNGTLYAGVTSDMPKRAFEHREGAVKGFSTKYGCKMLVWYELHDTMLEAIAREKQIKAGNRASKLAPIEGLNPQWKDLYETLAWNQLHRHCERSEAIQGPQGSAGLLRRFAPRNDDGAYVQTAPA